MALGLAEGTMEAARSVAMENWLYIYKPPAGNGDPITSKGLSNFYHVEAANGKWGIVSGEKQETINGLLYISYFTIENVSRNSASGDIETVYNASRDDTSTLKIIVTISWAGSDPMNISEYVYRWRNLVCAQTDWSGGASSATTTCPATLFGSTDGNINTGAAGSIKLNPL